MNRTLILGIGNVLLSDEGAGIHTLEYLSNHYPALPGVEYLDGGTLSFTLAGPIEDADNLIVIDAARLQMEPGSVRCMIGEQMDRFLGTGKCSVHEVGLADLIDIATLTGSLPRNRALIGIQPEKIGWGESPSEPVAQAIPEAAGCVLKMISEWTGNRASATAAFPD